MIVLAGNPGRSQPFFTVWEEVLLELQLLRFQQVSEDTCKLQLFYVEVLELSLYFCKKLTKTEHTGKIKYKGSHCTNRSSHLGQCRINVILQRPLQSGKTFEGILAFGRSITVSERASKLPSSALGALRFTVSQRSLRLQLCSQDKVSVEG